MKPYHTTAPVRCDDCLRVRPRRLIWTFRDAENQLLHEHCKACDWACDDYAGATPDECIEFIPAEA